MKCVVLDQNQNILYKDYRRHRSNIKEVAMQFAKDIQEIKTIFYYTIKHMTL